MSEPNAPQGAPAWGQPPAAGQPQPAWGQPPAAGQPQPAWGQPPAAGQPQPAWGQPPPAGQPPAAGQPQAGTPWTQPPPGQPAGWQAPQTGQPAGWGVAPPGPGALPGQAATSLPTPARSLLAGLDPRGWRVTILAAIIMVGVVGGANVVNGAVATPAGGGTAAGGGPVAPGGKVSVADGVAFTVPAGWSVVSTVAGQVDLGRGSAHVTVMAGPYNGTVADLDAQFRSTMFSVGDKASDPEGITFGNGIPGMGALYAASVTGGQADGVYVVGASQGIGLVFNLFTLRGDLNAYQGDADALLGSITVTGAGR
jgi:hypothetical protein